MTERAAAYIHVPFCVRRCPYCAFFSTTAGREVQTEYLTALEREIRDRAPLAAEGVPTIYIGGGTPTALGVAGLARLLGHVRDSFFGPATREWTVEALPSTLTGEIAELLAGHGVNRVTLGMQSFATDVLDRIGRRDELDAFPRAVELLRAVGIENIGVDLIVGLPGESLASFRAGCRRLIDCGIPHVSAYMLHVEPGTPFDLLRSRGVPVEMSGLALRRMYTALCGELRRAGYGQYEVSNFCLPGHACRHNLDTWAGKQLAGYGAGAVGTLAGVRRHGCEDLAAYIAAPLVPVACESIVGAARCNETLLLSLRTRQGLDFSALRAELGTGEAERIGRLLENFVREGLLVFRNGRYCPVLRGFLWLDRMLVELFCPAEPEKAC